MKKLLILCSLFIVFFSCKKDNKRDTSSYGQAVEGLSLSYNHAYIFFFIRNNVIDSDRVIFHQNGTITEVSNRFDSGSYSYPDSLTYTVNTSFDNGIIWNNIPGTMLMSFYPIYEAINPSKHFLLHDYLNNEVVELYKTKGSFALPSILNINTAEDSVYTITGFLKKDN